MGEKKPLSVLLHSSIHPSIQHSGRKRERPEKKFFGGVQIISLSPFHFFCRNIWDMERRRGKKVSQQCAAR